MADLTIAQLTELLAPAVDNLDLLPIWDDSASETKKITINNFRTAVGVTNWSETFSSATQATSRWLPNNAAANVNAAVVPKGTGALLASIPDGTTVGGNARGQYSVDFQMSRTAADQVASGNYNFIGSGQQNKAENFNNGIVSGLNNRITGAPSFYPNSYSFIGSGENNNLQSRWGVICGGINNTVANNTVLQVVIGGGTSNTITTGNQNFIGAGNTNTINNGAFGNGVIVGGTSNSVTGTYASVVGGQTNTASATYSFVGGGIYNIASGDRSVIVGGGSTSVVGDGNRATGTLSFVGGGIKNTASGTGSVVVGGGQSTTPNTASGNFSFIGGGFQNSVTGANSSIVGGGYSTTGNSISAQQCFIGGGYGNSINGTGLGNFCSAIVGGGGNSLTGGASIICGGESNTIQKPEVNSGNWCFLGGGRYNDITGPYSNESVLVGGNDNTVGNGYTMTLVGGAFNSINGSKSFIGGGESNVIGSYPTHATIPGGRSNSITANGNYAAVGGGQSNTASQSHAVVSGGQSNTASAIASTVVGGYNATASLYGQVAHASGQFAAAGDAQAHELVWRRAITGNGITELFLDGASVAAILPGTNCLWQGTIDIAAICTVVGNGTTTLGDAQGTTYKVTIKRLGTATTLVGSVQEIGTMNADPSALGGFTIDANNTNESLRIQYTPPATAGSTTVHRVVATFKGLQIQF